MPRASAGCLIDWPGGIGSIPILCRAQERISGETPVYTEKAVIAEQGNVAETRVLKGLPMGLDRAAVEAVRTWKFKPATLSGQPSRSTTS